VITILRLLALSSAAAVLLAHAPATGDAQQSPPGPASPATTGEVFVGPVDAVLDEHDVDVTLRGSPASMARQHAVAVASELSFVGTLEVLAGEGALVAIDGGPYYEVMDWVFPYGLPPVQTFVERVAYEYRETCGETMVVTSLARPFSEQPGNAHQLSVHPAGMAVDLRVPQNPECRAFLESRLLEKEEEGLVDITHERSPPHYHVAVYPAPYERWAAVQEPPPEPPAETGPEPVADPETMEGGGQWVLIVGLMVLILALGLGWWFRREREA
jgi:hypothetical protein